MFHVIDSKTEENFDFEERPYEFIDIETGEKLKLQVSEVKDFYKENIHKNLEELILKCGQSKIDFIPVDIRESVNQVLLSYLIKRSRMK